jgi:hypothetical protein
LVAPDSTLALARFDRPAFVCGFKGPRKLNKVETKFRMNRFYEEDLLAWLEDFRLEL